MRISQAYNWSQIKGRTYHYPFPSPPLHPTRPPSVLPLSGIGMLLPSLDQLCHAPNHGFHPLPSGKYTKPGHPKREVSKACLRFLIALFSATTRICLMYAQAEPGQPRNCLTLTGPQRDGFGLLLVLSGPLFLKATYTRDKHKQTYPKNASSIRLLCFHLSKRIVITMGLLFSEI